MRPLLKKNIISPVRVFLCDVKCHSRTFAAQQTSVLPIHSNTHPMNLRPGSFAQLCLVATSFLMFNSYGLAAGLSARFSALKQQIDSVTRGQKCQVAVSLRLEKSGQTLTIRGQDKCPMMSVVKVPIALLILKKVDEGRWKLNDSIMVDTDKWMKHAWSPLGDRLGFATCHIRIDTLLWAMIAESDNNACDFLFELCGGPKSVEKYMHSLGFKDMQISVSERGFVSPKNQYENWVHAQCYVDLLQEFKKGRLLSAASTKELMRMMTESVNPSDRIKAGVPAGTVVAHKTGTGDLYKGKIAGVNDVAIITLPDGSALYLTVFIHDADTTQKQCSALIATISRLVWAAAIQE